MTLYKYLKKQKANQRKLWAVLLDPDKIKKEDILPLIDKINYSNPDLILVGGSFMTHNTMSDLVKSLKRLTDKPVIIFPGSPSQICYDADALLFLSLISGRNSEYLIGKQVEAAPFLFNSALEVIPTGYILTENDHITTVEYISNTKPIPRKKTNIALATAMAGELLGLKMLYLEAGSGAKKPVPLKIIQAISSKVSLPLIVGGGIKNKKQMLKAWVAGADLVIIGTAFENNSF